MKDYTELIISLLTVYSTIMTVALTYLSVWMTARNMSPRINIKLANGTINTSMYQSLSSSDLIIELKFFDKSSIPGLVDNIYVKNNGQKYYGKIANLTDFHLNNEKFYYNTQPNCKFPITIPSFSIIYCAFIFPGLNYNSVKNLPSIHFECVTINGIRKLNFDLNK